MSTIRISCIFQDEIYLKEFCDRNNFPMLDRRTKEFDVHTKQFKNFTSTEAVDLDTFYEKAGKFITKSTETKKLIHYDERKFPLWWNAPRINGYEYKKGAGSGEYSKIIFKFREDDTLEFKKKMFWWVNITEKTKVVKFVDERYKYITSHVIACDYDEEVTLPRYPIYVISKGRAWLSNGTSGTLSRLQIPHFVVVEPDEEKEYQEKIANEYAKILVMDMKYIDEYDRGESLGDDTIVGPGAKRNFVWDHSTAAGAKWHWVMDDNAYYMKNRLYNYRFFTCTGNYLCALEDFIDKFKNLGQAGCDYNFFYPDHTNDTPYILNTRCFSFILNNNFITNKEGKHYRWEGRYSEDVDLSLRILKDGWSTMDFRFVLFEKALTQTCKGGCDGEIYSKEGTDNKSIFIARRHPDCCRVVKKYGRTHHHVDYRVFKQQPLLKDEWKEKLFELPKYNDYRTILINIDDGEVIANVDRKTIKEKYKDRIRGPQQFILVDADNVDSEKLKDALDKVIRSDRSPLILTDVFVSNAVNKISKICRDLKYPALNYLYCYDDVFNRVLNDNIFSYGKVSVICEKDTTLFKNLDKYEIENKVIFD